MLCGWGNAPRHNIPSRYEIRMTFTIMDAMNSYQKETGDSNLAFLQFPNTTDKTIGAHAHPGEQSHARAAKILIEYLQTILEA